MAFRDDVPISLIQELEKKKIDLDKVTDLFQKLSLEVQTNNEKRETVVEKLKEVSDINSLKEIQESKKTNQANYSTLKVQRESVFAKMHETKEKEHEMVKEMESDHVFSTLYKMDSHVHDLEQRNTKTQAGMRILY